MTSKNHSVFATIVRWALLVEDSAMEIYLSSEGTFDKDCGVPIALRKRGWGSMLTLLASLLGRVPLEVSLALDQLPQPTF